MLLLVLLGSAFSEPAKEREWTSTAGTSLKVSALGIEGGAVRLRKPDGTEMMVLVVKLSPRDQDFFDDHFGGRELATVPGKSASLWTSLAHPAGVVSGPHDAGDGSHYFIYIPKTMKENRKAPLLLYTGPTGGTAGHVKAHVKGAEVNGWIVAANVESKTRLTRRATTPMPNAVWST